MSTTLTSKGQVTVPKKIRDYLGLRPGSSVSFTLGPEGEVIVKPAKEAASARPKRRFDKLRGSHVSGKSTDELMQLLRGYDADVHDPALQ